MEDPLAACKSGPVAPDTLSAHDAGVTETWAPVLTKKRLLDFSSVTNSCEIFGFDVGLVAAKHSGLTNWQSSAGPLSRFPSFLFF